MVVSSNVRRGKTFLPRITSYNVCYTKLLRIVIDAKFPLESYHALRNAKDDAEKTIAARGFKADIIKHINDISEKYIIAGETAESALMFLPSEAVYAELHASFADVVEKSYRAKVWIVSPTTLMATLNTIRAVLKDANMREQAGVIQKEVGILLDDIARLDKRVSNLGSHFEQASKDIREITISTDKITKRAEKIEEIQVNDGVITSYSIHYTKLYDQKQWLKNHNSCQSHQQSCLL